jgi:hypothetical protein
MQWGGETLLKWSVAHDRRVAMNRLYTLASVAFVFSAPSLASPLTAEVPNDDQAFIVKAMTAAPPAISQKATIVRVGDGFKLTPIRRGTNAWTCAVDPDGTPWCSDANGLLWFAALFDHAEPPDKTGFIYMMAGDLGTSNQDPYATDKAHWVKTGPHVMIVGRAAQEMAANYPNALDPDPTQPYLKFPDRKYQLIVFPLETSQGH